MRRVLRGAAIVGRAVVAILVLLVVLSAFVPRLLPVDVLYVRSGSMAPGMGVGSLAVFTRADAGDLHEGDVIAFGRPDVPGAVVTHRIVAVTHDGGVPRFVTKGDANRHADPWRVDAVGSGWRRVLSVPYAGFALGYTRAVLGMRFVLPALVWCGVAVALARVWRRQEPVGAT